MPKSADKETSLFIANEADHKTIYDYSKLVGRIIEKYGTRENFAKAFGCSVEHLSKFLNNKWYLKQPGIDKMCRLLDSPDKEIYYYFFVQVVQTA